MLTQAGSKCSHSLPTTPATALAPTAPMATSGSAMHVAQRTSPIAATASNFPLFADERIAQQHHQQQFANNPLLQMERMTQEAMMQQEPQPVCTRAYAHLKHVLCRKCHGYRRQLGHHAMRNT
jgi:hypothetical protein